MVEAPKIIKGDCPDCEGERNAEVKRELEETWSDDDNGIAGGVVYRILQCRGCDSIYVQKESWFSEDLDYRHDPRTGEIEVFVPSKFEYWPSLRKTKRPAWRLKLPFIDKQLYSLLEEVYSACDADLRVLAAVGVRTTFDRASELLGVNPAKSFQEKLNELADSGNIGTAEKGTLSTLTDAGSAAAHRGWRPNQEELDIMLEVMEAFLNRNFILEGAVKQLKNAVPAKPKRTAAKVSPPAGAAKSTS